MIVKCGGACDQYSMTIFLILFFLITNLFKDLVPIPLNQITGGAIIICMVLCIKKLTKLSFWGVLFYILSIVCAACYSFDVSIHIKYSIYFILNIAVYVFLLDDSIMEQLEHKVYWLKQVVSFVLFLYVLSILVMYNLPVCYSTDLWQGIGVFQAFSVPHGVAGSSCLYITISLVMMQFVEKDRLKKILYSCGILFNLFVILQTGARTYLFPALAIIMLMVFMFVKSMKNRIYILLSCFSGFGGIVFFSSTFQKKMEYSLSFQDINGFTFFQAITSSRSLIWANDLYAFFFESTIVQQILGGGFSRSYEMNSLWTYTIQAHNGFLELLISTGVVGIVFYCKFLKKILSKYNYKKSFLKVFLLIYIPLVVFWDDILQAPAYMLSFIFLIMSLKMKYQMRC